MELTKNIKQIRILKFIFLALIGTIILAISSKIKIPFYPVPMTMQTLVVLSIGVILGWKLGLVTIMLYLFEGLVGLPVFAGTPEKGIGLAYFTGPTMGYLLGFIPAVFFAGFFKINIKYNLIYKILINFIYIFGLIWLFNFVPLDKLWALGVLPFLPAELFKISILTLCISFLDKSKLSWRSFR